jgi:hypothetical protein
MSGLLDSTKTRTRTSTSDFTIVTKLPAAIMKDLYGVYTINEESILEPITILETATRKTRRDVGALDARNT